MSCLTGFFFYSLNGSSGFIRGPGENPKPLGFSFHDKFKQGPLLSVVSSSCFFFFFFIRHFLKRILKLCAVLRVIMLYGAGWFGDVGCPTSIVEGML